jgi:hypothetical protein
MTTTQIKTALEDLEMKGSNNWTEEERREWFRLCEAFHAGTMRTNSEGWVWSWKGYRIYRIPAEDAAGKRAYALYLPGDDEAIWFASRRAAETFARTQAA